MMLRFAKSSILDVWQGSEYASELHNKNRGFIFMWVCN